MGLLTIEHSKAAYRIDFAAYGGAIVVVAMMLAMRASVAPWLPLLLSAAAGLAGWTVLEYGLHRFVLHGLQPFAAWHGAHHQRPTALICAPTLFSGALIVGTIFVPAWLASDVWIASALTLGVMIGYLMYAVIHHGIHHWRSESAWLTRRKRWHARHHRAGQPTGRFGVTTDFWDRVFGTGHVYDDMGSEPWAAAGHAQQGLRCPPVSISSHAAAYPVASSQQTIHRNTP